jgi:DNA-directed RNA polymerase specialized sigma24 family protein
MDKEFPVAKLPERPTRHKPDTVIQAVMEAGFGQEPVTSREESTALMDVVYEAFQSLPAEERMLLEAVVFERASFRQLEARWGVPKTTLHRWWAGAVLRLRCELIEFPEIQTYLEGNVR